MSIVPIMLLVAALALLAGGAEALVRGSVAVAQRMGVSSFFIGVTVVGFGTSTPELAASVTAAAKGFTDINVGNVIGSNICNIALILGVTAIIAPIIIHRRVVRAELWIVIVVSAIPILTMLTGLMLPRWMAIAMLGALAVTVWRGYRIGRAEHGGDADGMDQIARSVIEPAPQTWMNHPGVQIGAIVIGLAALVGGSQLLVGSAVTIARELGMSELVIGLTIVAIGTSAPELVTSVLAAARGQSDLSVGNIFGSNIFNLLGILAISAVITPQSFSMQTYLLDVPMMLVVTLACLPIMASGGGISRREGVALVLVYAVYIWLLFAHAPTWFSGG